MESQNDEITTAEELFNAKPSRHLAYLLEQGFANPKIEKLLAAYVELEEWHEKAEPDSSQICIRDIWEANQKSLSLTIAAAFLLRLYLDRGTNPLTGLLQDRIHRQSRISQAEKEEAVIRCLRRSLYGRRAPGGSESLWTPKRLQMLLAMYLRSSISLRNAKSRQSVIEKALRRQGDIRPRDKSIEWVIKEFHIPTTIWGDVPFAGRVFDGQESTQELVFEYLRAAFKIRGTTAGLRKALTQARKLYGRHGQRAEVGVHLRVLDESTSPDDLFLIAVPPGDYFILTGKGFIHLVTFESLDFLASLDESFLT